MSCGVSQSGAPDSYMWYAYTVIINTCKIDVISRLVHSNMRLEMLPKQDQTPSKTLGWKGRHKHCWIIENSNIPNTDLVWSTLASLSWVPNSVGGSTAISCTYMNRMSEREHANQVLVWMRDASPMGRFWLYMYKSNKLCYQNKALNLSIKLNHPLSKHACRHKPWTLQIIHRIYNFGYG